MTARNGKQETMRVLGPVGTTEEECRRARLAVAMRVDRGMAREDAAEILAMLGLVGAETSP